VNFSTGLTSYNTNAIGATLGAGPGSLVSPSRSILIYSGTDDQQTPPDGNPGSPIGCGVILGAGAAAASGSAVPAQVVPSTISQVVPPAVRSGVSPVAVAKPAAANASVVPSPSPVVAAAPTPILILPTPVPLVTATQVGQASSGPSLVNIGLIAVLGLALIGGGLLLRRGSAETKQQRG
jgi:hypothetical protein